ncbi:MAG TPA: nuclear transport factor 2 family protein, partial [Thermoleophilaceae bacterium]|nr:nuclear transport factor 2 family protein [Thermoleophilaceae bacterium]
MDRRTFTTWIERYEAAWRTAGTAVLDHLFAEDATYSPAPFDEVMTGRAAIADFWEAERDGPEEMFTLSAEAVAVEGDTGVARVEVTYGDPRVRRYRDLWIVALGPD